MTIKVETIYACNDDELQEKLNGLNAIRVISIEEQRDEIYRVIYEAEDN